MCLYPKLIQNPKYKKNKKNGGNIPAVTDSRVMMVPIGCQKCIECLKQKANNWKARLTEEIQTRTNGKFIGLTFSNEEYKKLYQEVTSKKILENPYDIDNQIASLAIHRFRERWRKKFKTSVRYWMITELGHNGTENIHMHGIIWHDNIADIEERWGYGYILKGKTVNGQLINYVSERSLQYMMKYVTKVDPQHKQYIPIIRCSDGIGSEYLKQNKLKAERNKYNGKDTEETYRMSNGTKIGLPIYLRNKLYTDSEREQLWLHKLDKQVRYVLGVPIDISKGEEEYNKALKYAQMKNIEMGYGGEPTTWEETQYERERRILKQKQRMEDKTSYKNNNNK